MALAVCLGFENVYVAGFDLLKPAEKMHTYDVGERVIKTIEGYERNSIYDTTVPKTRCVKANLEHVQKTHPESMQVKFIHLLEKIYPKTQILSVSKSSEINEYIQSADRIYDTPWYSPEAKPNDRTTDWYPLPESMPSRKKNTSGTDVQG